MVRPWKTGTAAQRAANAVVSAAGDLGTTTDTADLVVGDGSTVWGALKRLVRVDEVTTAVQQYVTSLVVTGSTLAGLAAESGYTWALVDANGKIALGVTPSGQVIGKISLANGTLNAVTFDATTLTQITGAGAGPQLQPLTIEQSSQWVYAITGAAGGVAFAIAPDGTVTIPKLTIPAGAINFTQLSTALQAAIPQSMPVESGALWAVTDSLGRTALSIASDGSLIIAKSAISSYSLRDSDGASYLAHPFRDANGQYQIEVTRKSDGAKTIKTTATGTDTVEPIISADGVHVLYRDNSSGTMTTYYRLCDGTGVSWPVVPLPTIYCPGDSLTAGSGTTNGANAYPAVLGTTLGVATVNDGIGGTTGENIAARANGAPFALTAGVTVPATTTPVAVGLNTSGNAAADWTRTGSLGGIPGTLSWSQIGQAYTFTRTTAGGSTALLTGVTFLTDNGVASQAETLSIFLGRNNFEVDSGSTIVSEVQAILNYHKAYLTRFVVLEIPPATADTTGAGTLARGTYRDSLDAANNALAAAFPNNFLAIATYLRSAQAAIDAGITFTSQDNIDIANGITPTSFRSDNIHFNDLSYPLVGRFVAAAMRAKGWYA